MPPILEDLVVLQQQWSVQQEQTLALQRKWRGQLSDDDGAPGATISAMVTADGFVLGPAYIYGSQPDPILFFFGLLPDVGGKKAA